ncbi:MAG: Transcriptional regulator AcuR [Syntrophomonadaceae bacterium]|nr:Transcriptional regulator AcuR [Bacillota bacterium]
MAHGSLREEIVRKGAALIHAQGFSATGIQQVLAAAGIPKGSFYYYFSSKEDFGLAVIDYFTSNIGEIFNRCLKNEEVPPLKRLENLFMYFENVFQKAGCALGCPVGNLSLELAGSSERLRSHLEAAVSKLILRIETCLREAKQDHSVSAGLDTHDTAQFIFHAFEGAILHMKVKRNIEPYRAFRRHMAGYLKK